MFFRQRNLTKNNNKNLRRCRLVMTATIFSYPFILLFSNLLSFSSPFIFFPFHPLTLLPVVPYVQCTELLLPLLILSYHRHPLTLLSSFFPFSFFPVVRYVQCTELLLPLRQPGSHNGGGRVPQQVIHSVRPRYGSHREMLIDTSSRSNEFEREEVDKMDGQMDGQIDKIDRHTGIQTVFLCGWLSLCVCCLCVCVCLCVWVCVYVCVCVCVCPQWLSFTPHSDAPYSDNIILAP